VIFDLHSEAFGPDGNLSAEGYENLMGIPSLELLQVLIREAVQNICDATRSDVDGAVARIRLRQLDQKQAAILARKVFGNRPLESVAQSNLATALDRQGCLNVLEIADFGTSGLGGITRADQEPAEGERPDFVNFFRNVGAARDVEGGAGTYGYGKSTLYRASGAHAILVDTLTKYRDQSVRRMMSAQLGHAVPGRFTGRHWWGQTTADGKTVDPVVGSAAVDLATSIGLPERGTEDFGTTIMILAPHFVGSESNSAADIISAIKEYAIWNFWPRMMATTPAGKQLRIEVSTGGDWEAVPSPETFPPISLLCKAMNGVRFPEHSSDGCRLVPIRIKQPLKDLGQMSIAEGPIGKRRWLLPPPSVESEREDGEQLKSTIPSRLHHVALMRPAELVVKYLAGNPSPDDDVEWAAVFRCSSEREVEEAFARAEPPAHDDWQPSSLPARSWERSYVNVALKRIRENLPHSRASLAEHYVDRGDTSLGHVSELLGRFLPAGGGEGASRNRGSAGGGARKVVKFSQPEPMGLESGSKGPVAVFEVELHPSGDGLSLLAEPLIMLDGKPDRPDEATGIPTVLDWENTATGEKFTGQSANSMSPGNWRVRVTVPSSAAVSLRVKEIQQA
jgi:hypothetical protein